VRHGSLFSGIGGFDLAAQWMGWENVFQVEIDPFCQKVLEKNFPGVTRYGNIKEFDGTKYRGAIDILSGGFPCQDLSVASSNGRAGLKGKKSGLYQHLIRCIRELKPPHVVIENVYGLVTQDDGQALETLCTDLAIEGFETIPLVLYASAFGANHHRKRFFAYATRERNGLPPWQVQAGRNIPINIPGWDTEPGICRVYDGVPEQLDKRRLAGLGNAVPPPIAYEIFKAIDLIRKQGIVNH
jgi:DNA (cytosine-5)-methyltransferase 1